MLNTILLSLSEAVSEDEIKCFYHTITNDGNKIGCEIKIFLLEKTEQLYEYDAQESILVTDLPEFFQKAYIYKMPGVAYFHKTNNMKSFTDASYAITTLYDIHYDYLERVYRRFFGIPWEILRTDRCLVREITVQDVDELYEIYRDKSITRYTENLYENPEEEKEYVRQYIENMYGFYGFGMWIVQRINDGKIIGRAGLDIRAGYEDTELGYVIRKDEQGKGYAREVCSAILDYAAEELEVDKVLAFIHPENRDSIHLCENLGFERCGEALISDVRMEQYVWKKGKCS